MSVLNYQLILKGKVRTLGGSNELKCSFVFMPCYEKKMFKSYFLIIRLLFGFVGILIVWITHSCFTEILAQTERVIVIQIRLQIL